MSYNINHFLITWETKTAITFQWNGLRAFASTFPFVTVVPAIWCAFATDLDRLSFKYTYTNFAAKPKAGQKKPFRISNIHTELTRVELFNAYSGEGKKCGEWKTVGSLIFHKIIIVSFCISALVCVQKFLPAANTRIDHIHSHTSVLVWREEEWKNISRYSYLHCFKGNVQIRAFRVRSFARWLGHVFYMDLCLHGTRIWPMWHDLWIDIGIIICLHIRGMCCVGFCCCCCCCYSHAGILHHIC